VRSASCRCARLFQPSQGNAGTGERFEVELWGLTGQVFGIERQLSILAAGWTALGAQVDFQGIPPSRLSDAQYVADIADRRDAHESLFDRTTSRK
jgi:hypothetical protein